MTADRRAFGRSGERLAAAFLKKKGYQIHTVNYRTRSGEIDIIAERKNIIVFVEVKSRNTDSFGPPVLAITPRKQRQISKTALEYISSNKLFDTDARFDVISIYYQNKKPVVDHITNAFELHYG